MDAQHKDWALHSESAPKLPEPGKTIRVTPEIGLPAARDAVRKWIAAGLPAGGVEVTLAAGEYELDETFCFDERDSGTPYAPVVWRAEDGAKVLLSGGRRLPDEAFAPVEEGDPLYRRLPEPARALVCDLRALGVEAEAPSGGYGEAYSFENTIAPYNRNGNAWQELFLGDAPLQLVRYPESGYLRTVRGEVGEVDTCSKVRFGCDDARLEAWEKPEQAYLHGYFRFDWANAVVRVGRYDRDTHTLETAEPLHFGVRDNMRYFFLNVPEELRAAGQYYLDGETGRLYLIPTENFGKEPLRLSRVKDALLRFDNASHIRLRGLTLAFARGSGALVFGGDGVALEGCTLCNLGYTGVRVGEPSSFRVHMPDRVGNGGVNHLIRSCDIWNTGFGGAYISAGNRETLAPCGIRVENCDFHDFGRIGKCYYFAVTLSSVGVAIANNRFHAGPHSAIWFDGNDNVIEYNEFYDLLRESDDAAAIYCGRDYTLGGNVVRYNFFHDMKSDAETGVSVFGTYCDDNSASLAYYGNLYYRMQGAHLSHGGHDIVFENNLIAEGFDNTKYSVHWVRYGYPRTLQPGGEHDGPYKNAPADSPLWRSRFPHLREYWTWEAETEQVNPHYCSYRGNAFIRHKPISVNFAWDTEKYGNVMENNYDTEEDAGFVDEEHMDLRLREDSPVYRNIPGFQPIPFEKMGLYRDEFRRA